MNKKTVRDNYNEITIEKGDWKICLVVADLRGACVERCFSPKKARLIGQTIIQMADELEASTRATPSKPKS